MPLNLQQEAFIAERLAGKSAVDAYISAGYRCKTRAAALTSAARLDKQPAIIEAIERLKEERARIRAEATKLAIERSAITMERVAVELGRIGFANMGDYMRVDQGGNPIVDFSNLTREQTAAITSLHIMSDSVKFSLGDKRAALMDIAKLFGWIIDKRETKIVDEFENMSDQEIEAWLDERAEARLKMRHRASAEVQRRGGIGTLRPATTAQGKPH
jgi:phage terminase small subunit